MAFQGVPRLWAALRGNGYRILLPYEGVGACTLTPSGVALALTPSGAPDFAFDYIRRDDQSTPIYAVLSFRVEPLFPFDDALQQLRATDPHATLRNISFTAGFLRLKAIGTAHPVPDSLLAPLPLVWDGSGAARFSIELTGDAAQFVGGLLEQQLISLLAYLELEFAGVSPILPLTVSFDPERLIAALAPDRERRVSRDVVFRTLRDRLDTVPLEWDGDPRTQPADLVAQAVTNVLRTRLGTFVPAPIPDGDGYFAFQATGGAGSRETWNLREPFAARESVVLSLNPFDALYQVTRGGNIKSVIHFVTVPPLNFGALPVAISANFPDGMDAQVGVELHAPANAPSRPQAIWSGRILLDPPDYLASRTLRFSPAERSPSYVFRTSCDLPDGEYVEGDDRPAPTDPTRLVLGAADLPVDLVGIACRPRLLRIARITGDASWVDAGLTRHREFALDETAALITLAVPRTATSRALTIRIAPRVGTATAIEIQAPLESALVDLTSFAEFGTHTLELSCTFPADEGRAVIVDIQGAAGGEVTPVRVTPASPRTSFSWYAESPFEPGYRFRQHSVGDWSEVQPPFEPLRLAFDSSTGHVYPQTEVAS
jgi:hypothetical protein